MAPNKTDKNTSTLSQPLSAVARPGADPIEGLYHKWIIPFGWRIAIVILIALLGVALGRTLMARRAERLGAGFAALSKAEDTDALLAVAREHDGSPAATRAQLEAARRVFDDAKYDQAATKFSLARKAAQDSTFAVAASLGEAYAVEASGKPDVAEKSFAAIASNAGLEALTLDAWLGAGRCAKAQGKLAEAEKYYARAKEAAGESPFARRRVTEAQNALASARYATRAAEPAKPADAAAPDAPAAPAAPGATPAPPATPATPAKP